MHTYAGNPANWATSVSLGDDGVDAPQFATFNTPPEGLADRTAYLYSQRYAQALANWRPKNANLLGTSGSTPTVTLTAACWDPIFGQWLLGYIGSSNLGNAASWDGGQTWVGSPRGRTGRGWYTSDQAPVAIAVSPLSGTCCALSLNTGAGLPVNINRTTHTSSVATTQSFLAGQVIGAMIFFSGYGSGSGEFVYVGASSVSGGTFTGAAATSADGAGAWLNATSGLPSGWGGSSITNVPIAFLADQSPTAAVFALCAATPGASGNTSRLLQMSVAGAFTDITPSFLGGTAKQIRGLAYSSLLNLWGILAIDGSNSYLYTSPDLNTWTLVHTFTGYLCHGLTVIGAAWSTLASYTGSEYTDGTTGILVSTDVSHGTTCTWQVADYFDSNGLNNVIAAGSAATMGRMLSSGSQAMALVVGGGGPSSTPGNKGGTVAISFRAAPGSQAMA